MPAQVLADEAQAALAIGELAVARAQIALNSAVRQAVEVARGWLDFR